MKKNMKKILAFLCAVVLFVTAVFTGNTMNQAQAETGTSTETSTEPTPVELYGFENVTIDDFNHYQTNNIMTEGDYRYGVTNFYKLFDGSNLDKKLFTAYIKFSYTDGNPWDTRIHVGGSQQYTGLAIYTNAEGTTLTIKETNTETTKMVGEFSKTVSNTDVGVDSFKEEFLLQIGYEYGDFDNDNSGTADDVRVLVYVEGTEVYKDYIKDANTSILGGYIHLACEASSSVITVSSVHNPVEPEEVSGFTNRTVGDFVYEGTTNPMEEKAYVSTDTRAFMSKDGENFDKKLFTANVQFNNPSGNYWDTRLYIGGAWTLKGLAVCVSTDGTSLILQDFSLSNEELSSNFENKSVTATEAGVISFKDEFLLQVGYEYLDKDSDGNNETVRALVFVNGKRVLDETIENCNMNFLGNYVGIYTTDADESVKISSFQEDVKPVTLSSHKTVSISDFQDSAGKEMESKAYDYDGTTPSFSLKDESADYADKLLSMKVKFGYRDGITPSYETRMEIPASDGSGGIWIYADNAGLHIDDTNGDLHRDTVTCADADVSSFINTPFILQISLTDTTDGLKVGVYINGSLSKEFPWNSAGEKVNVYSANLNLNRGIENSYITVCDINEDEFPKDPLIMPDSTFEKITFGSFGYVDGTYSGTLEDGKYAFAESLDKVVLCGRVKLVGNSFFNIRLGGNESTWDEGLYLAPLAGGENMEVKWRSGSTVVKDYGSFTSDVAGVNFIGDEYDLMISIEVVNETDVQFGIWFDGKLYNDQYYDVSGVGANLGNMIGWTIPTGGTITLGSVKEYLPQPDESYEEVTFQHFALKDGTYDTKGDDWVFTNDFKKKDNLDKIVLCGDVLLGKADSSVYSLSLGGKTDPNNGIRLWTNGEQISLLVNGSSIGTLYPADAGMGDSFLNKTISLMWSVEFYAADSDGTYNDIKVGLWFNDFLYGGDYFRIKDCSTADEFGSTFAVCCQETDNFITLNSSAEIMNLPGEEFGKLSLPDFVHNGTTDIMESGTFSSAKSDGWYVSGNTKDGETLDKKVVSFDVLQSGTEGAASYRMRIGGISNHWYGLVLNTDPDGNMKINWCGSDGVIKEEDWVSVDMNQTAVSSFVNETFNLMVSMELVEANGNTTSDVKVRIWFNKIPYVHNGQDSFIYYDRGNDIGNILSVGVDKVSGKETEKAFVSLRTVAEYQSNPNYYEDISEYRQGTGYTAPDAPEGYVFSGWYADEDYETALARDKVDGSAYAKFTEDDVLKVKAQVKLSDGALPTDETALRFVTTVDSLKYRNVAFKYEIQMSDGSFSTEYDSYATSVDKELAKKVYRKMYYVGQDTGELSYKPNAFSWMSEYFKAWTLSGIKAAQYDTTIRITPYWITMDGTTVEGETRDVCVNDFDVSAYENTSQAVTIDFLGQNTMPIGGLGLWPTTDEDTMLFPDYVTEEYFKLFADAGVNLLVHSGVDYKYDSNSVKKQLEYGEKYGIGVFVEDSELHTIAATGTDAQLAARLNEYSGYKAFSGIHLIDEPGVEGQWGYDSSQSAEANKSYTLYTTLAGKLKDTTLSNSIMYPLFPSWSDNWLEQLFGKASEEEVKTNYKNYVNTISSNLQNNIISWDHYPFEVERVNADADIYSTYFWNMDLIRTTAQNASKPFWAVIQAGSQWNNEDVDLETEKNTDGTAIYYPTQSQFNWNVNTSLAFGAQGIQYFPLVQMKKFAKDNVDAEWDFERNGLLSAWGGKTQWYYYAQEMNKQIAAIDEVLMNSVNEGVIASGTTATYVNGLDAVKTNYGKLSSVNGNALVGCFNYSGKTALYVVNCDMYDHNSTTSQDTTQDITLQFTENCSMKRIQKAKSDEVSTESNNQLTLTIEAGEGVLLVLE